MESVYSQAADPTVHLLAQGGLWVLTLDIDIILTLLDVYCTDSWISQTNFHSEDRDKREGTAHLFVGGGGGQTHHRPFTYHTGYVIRVDKLRHTIVNMLRN